MVVLSMGLGNDSKRRLYFADEKVHPFHGLFAKDQFMLFVL